MSSNNSIFSRVLSTLHTGTQRTPSDIESQIGVESFGAGLPVAPPSTRNHPPRARHSMLEGTDPADDFFGVTYPSRPTRPLVGTQDSRHDNPPPYVCASEPPAYTQVSVQPTLAMYLFKLGFLFPPFWILGSLILLTPLAAPAEWEPSKPEMERQEWIASMRRSEMKWAKRSLLALSVLLLVILIIVLLVVFA